MESGYRIQIADVPIFGSCEHCHSDGETYEVTMTYGVRSQKNNLCKICAEKAKRFVDRKNEELFRAEEEPDNDSSDQSQKSMFDLQIAGERFKSFLSQFHGFFSKAFWKKAIDKAYVTICYYHIIKKIILVSPAIAFLLFLFDIAGVSLGWLSLIAAFLLLFFVLTLDYVALSPAAAIPNTLLAIGTFVGGIIMYREPVILIFGLLALAQMVIHWLLILKEYNYKFTKAFLILSFVEFGILPVFLIVSLFIRGGIFFYFLACVFYFLPQVIQIVMYYPLDNNDADAMFDKIFSVRSRIYNRCREKEKEYLELSEFDNASIQKQIDSESASIRSKEPETDQTNSENDIEEVDLLNEPKDDAEYHSALADARQEFESTLSDLLNDK